MALRTEYVDFAKAYGDANNKQLLLNLARLANRDPVNFLQLGSFSSQYTFTAGAAFNPSDVNNIPGAGVTTVSSTGAPTVGESVTRNTAAFTKNALTLGGSANVAISEQPIFQYLPLTGTNMVMATFLPISEKVFLSLYDQGYPADLLARTMFTGVTRVSRTTNSETHQCVTNYDYDYLINSPTARTYPKFLEFCWMLRIAQRSQALFVQNKTTSDNVQFSSKDLKAKDVIAAIQANLSVFQNTNNGDVVLTQPTQRFFLDADPSLRQEDLGLEASSVNPNELTNNRYFVAEMADTKALYHDMVEVLANIHAGNYIFKMRTVESALFTAANEEVYFRDFTAQRKQPVPGIQYFSDSNGPYAVVEHRIKVRPLMRLTCEKGEKCPTEKLAEIKYGDGIQKTYFVGDPENVHQNHTVFTVLSYLFAQTAISTQNLPVQQLIKVQ